MVVAAFSKVLVLFTLALSVSGLATPHVVRSPHGHHALAARMAAPAPSPAVGPYGREVKIVKPKRKRQDSGRCKARTSAAPTSTSSEAPEPTSSTEPIANVAAAPSSSSEAPAPPPETPTPEPSPEPSPEPTTSEAPAPTPSDSGNSDNSGNSGNSDNSNLPSFLVGTQTGQGKALLRTLCNSHGVLLFSTATFYDIGLGACGITNSGDDRIAAVSHLLFDSFP